MIGWFENYAKPAFEGCEVPKDWQRHIKSDWKHFSKYYTRTSLMHEQTNRQ